jgi:hypothetical protein
MSQCACRSALLPSGTSRGTRSEHHPVAYPRAQVRVSHIRVSRVSGRAQGFGVFLHGGDDDFVAARHGRRRRGGERNFTVCVAATELSESLTLRGDRGRADGAKREGGKTVDVVTLGNLCVDIVLNVPHLPPESDVEKLEYMQRLASSPPDEVSSSMFMMLLLGNVFLLPLCFLTLMCSICCIAFFIPPSTLR